MISTKPGNDFFAETQADWRDWLAENGQTHDEIWLVMYRKGSGVASIGYHEAIDEALCFGWVDSKAIRRDATSRYQRFTPRKPSSRWSKVNRERVERLVESGLMAGPGQAVIDHAKRTGSWDAFIDADNGVMPAELQDRLSRNPRALENFRAFPPSAQRYSLSWIAAAKRPETRARRIEQTVALAGQNIRVSDRPKAGPST